MADDILPELKPCKKCGSADRNSRGDCRPCVRVGAAARRPRYKEKMAEYAAAHVAHVAQRKAYMDAYNKRYYEKNAEAVKQGARDYLDKNRDAINEKERARYSPDTHWRKLNPGRNKQTVAKYVAENAGKRRVYEHCRRARKLKAEGELSQGIGDRLYALQKGKCACCRQPLGDEYHLDHIMPLALGGANSDDNIQLLRAKCNQQKNAKHPIDYMQAKGFLL